MTPRDPLTWLPQGGGRDTRSSSKTVRYDRLVPAVLVLGLVAALFVALIWVVTGSMSSHDTRSYRYRDDQRDYGYSLEVDKRLSKAPGKTLVPLSAAAASHTQGFYDKGGPRLGGRHGDGMQVSVLQMGSPITPDALPALKPVMVDMLWPKEEPPRNPFGGAPDGLSPSTSPAMTSSPTSSPGPVPKLSDTTVNGVPGFVSDEYEVTTAKGTYRAKVYILFKNDEYYVLATQARSDHWDSLKPIFEKAVGSFRID